MGLFSGLLGNASKKDNDKVERQLEGILIPGEQVWKILKQKPKRRFS